MAYSETSGEDVDLDNPNLDAALHQAEQLLGIPPEQARYGVVVVNQQLKACISYMSQPVLAGCSEQDYGYDTGLQAAVQVLACFLPVTCWRAGSYKKC